MAEAVESGGFLTSLILEIVQSPVNLALLLIITYLIYKIYKSHQPQAAPPPPEPPLPKLRRDFTVQELRQYDGRSGNGRVLVAVNGNVYDVTKGKKFYGPGNFFCNYNLFISHQWFEFG